MANQELQGKHFYCPLIDKNLSYENIKRYKNFFDTYDGGNPELYEKKGGREMSEWINKLLKTKRDIIYNLKDSKRNIGLQNQFIKSHDKNSENGSLIPTTPKINGLKTVYESINDEIQTIKYLIEYFKK